MNGLPFLLSKLFNTDQKSRFHLLPILQTGSLVSFVQVFNYLPCSLSEHSCYQPLNEAALATKFAGFTGTADRHIKAQEGTALPLPALSLCIIRLFSHFMGYMLSSHNREGTVGAKFTQRRSSIG